MKRYFSSIMLILSLLAICLITCSCGPGIIDFYIFSDIGECENINTYKDENATVTVYDTPQEDENLCDLVYNDFFAACYDSSDLKFDIFAYEFTDSDSAKKYYEKVTGTSQNSDTCFSAYGGMTTYTVVVIDGSNAYCANTTQKDSEELKSFLGEVFSKKIN